MAVIQSGLPLSACWMGENKPAPPGMPNDACWSLPSIDSRTFLGILCLNLQMFFSLSSMWSYLSSGSCIVNCFPSKFHPRISFEYAHVPLPLSSFFSAIESGWLSCRISVGKKECMPCSIACDNWQRFVAVIRFVAPMKSSTKTLIAFCMFDDIVSTYGRSGCIQASNLCECSNGCLSKRCWMTLCVVSDAAQKNGSDLHHPIWSDFGTIILMSLRSGVEPSSLGNTFSKFHALQYEHPVHQTNSHAIHIVPVVQMMKPWWNSSRQTSPSTILQ